MKGLAYENICDEIQLQLIKSIHKTKDTCTQYLVNQGNNYRLGMKEAA